MPILRPITPMLWMGCLMIFVTCSLAFAQQPTLDPQSLVGNWAGTWKFNQARGDYYLTVSRIENGTYYGSAKYTGTQSNAPQEIVGKLEGDVFKYSTNTGGTVVLKVDGDKMTGTGSGRSANAIEFSLQKNK